MDPSAHDQPVPTARRRVAVLGSVVAVAAVLAGVIVVALQSGAGEGSAAVPVTAAVVDCSNTRLYQSPGSRGLLTARVAVVDLTNNGSTVQTVEVLANGTALVTGNGTGSRPSSWTLQPGEMQAFSFPINPEKFGNGEGQCWSFPFAVKAVSGQTGGAPAPLISAAETPATAAQASASAPAEASAASESAAAEVAASASAEAAGLQQRALSRSYAVGAYSVSLSRANPMNTTTIDLVADVTSHDSDTGLAKQFGLAITLLNADGSVNASGTLCGELLGGTSQRLEFAPQQGTMAWASIRVSLAPAC
ncbi:hypothetical protein ABT095_26900 [Kitasatospora sp. NPDC002227]|uniref:hypothetical protein n=1 Tax=Kitasatospora sp. NPDC002227 TaxID=3154773 RepID=UPI0033267048